MEYILIEAQQQLEECLKEIKKSSYLSIDTESNSLYSYYEKLCLFQIATQRHIYLVDTFAVNIACFTKIFKDSSIEKIFHSAQSDISLIKKVCDCEFANIFDVMLAAKYCGVRKCGLSNLIEKCFSVKINKKYQKVNWGMRPLKKDMLDYAAMDVYYLKKLKDIFLEELKSRNLLDEFINHCSSLTKIPGKKIVFDPYAYLKINGSKNLSPLNLQVLKELYLKREEVARSMDIPSFKVISNETILKISLKPYEAIRNLRSFNGITNYVFNKHSSWILEAVKRGLENKNKEIILNKNKNFNSADFEKYKEKFGILKKWRLEKAKKRNLFPELIFTNDILWRIAHIENISIENLSKYGVDDYKIKLYGEELVLLFSDQKKKMEYIDNRGS